MSAEPGPAPPKPRRQRTAEEKQRKRQLKKTEKGAELGGGWLFAHEDDSSSLASSSCSSSLSGEEGDSDAAARPRGSNAVDLEDDSAAGAEGERASRRLLDTTGEQIGYRLKSRPETSVRIIHNPAAGIAFQLWPAAVALCDYLERQHVEGGRDDLRGKRVLELGAGTGLVGVMAALVGAHAVITDLPMVVEFMRENIQLNFGGASSSNPAGGSGSCVATGLAWGQPLPEGLPEFDYILASDCVYWEHLFEPLLHTLKLLCPPGSNKTLLVAQLKRRKVENRFFKRLSHYFGGCEDVEKLPTVVSKRPVRIMRLMSPSRR